jgi:hypothetical protein
MLGRKSANSAQEGADFVTRNEQSCDQLGQPEPVTWLTRRQLFGLGQFSGLVAARCAIESLQLPRVPIDADPFPVLQDEARDRPIGVDLRLGNRLHESEGQEPQ